MAAPTRELVGAALAHLRATLAVSALVGQRIWHRAPEGADFPYIAEIDTSALRDDATCLSREVVTMSVHVWTRDGVDPLQDARSLCFEVARALHIHPLVLPSNRLVTLEHRGERVFYDVDDLTGHGVVEFRAIISFN